VAIYRLLQHAAFDDSAVKVMTTAYEAVLWELGLADRSNPLTEIIAKKIIELAVDGERDPERLCELALQAIQADAANWTWPPDRQGARIVDKSKA